MRSVILSEPPEIDDGNIKSGEPVQAKEWKSLSKASNWLLGHGGTVVPAYPFMNISVSPVTFGIPISTTAYFRHKVSPREYAHAHLIIIRLAGKYPGSDTDINCNVSISINEGGYGDGGGYTRGQTVSGGVGPTLFLPINLDTISRAARVISISILNKSNSQDECIVEQIGIYEIPRYFMNKSQDDECAAEPTCAAGKYIKYADNASVRGPADGIEEAKSEVRRHIFYTAAPSGVWLSYADQSTWHRVVPYALTYSQDCLSRYLDGNTTTTLYANAYAAVTGGTGYVKFVTSYGSCTLTYTTSAATYHSTYGAALPVLSEDLSDDYGRRGGSYGVCQIFVRSTTTTGSVTLYAYGLTEKF